MPPAADFWPAALGPLLALAAASAALAWRLARRTGSRWRQEAGALALAELVALWLVSPYFGSGRVGAGDAYYYGVQLADYLEQVRHGIFPVQTGQTVYAFAGSILVRLSPYFFHLGGLLDLLSGRELSAFAVSNLAVIASAAAGAAAAYACVRILAPEDRQLAVLLAILYVLCPAAPVQLVGFDMIPTFLVLPWLPAFFLGAALSLAGRGGGRAAALATVAWAGIWYAHPAVALWLSPCFALVHLARLARERPLGRILLETAGLAAAFLGLTGYLFVSVQSLHLPSAIIAHYADPMALPLIIYKNLASAWPGVWRPLEFPVGVLGNIQLGLSLSLLLVACLALAWRQGLAGWAFALLSAGLFALLVPVPGLSPRLWHHMPPKVIEITNVWPMQRFYLILAALTVAWAALTVRPLLARPAARQGLLLTLTLGVAWSGWEALKIRRHAAMVREAPAASALSLLPQNAVLTVYAYNLFGSVFPPYYSHGTMDPAFESRLLDTAMNPTLDNASALAAERSRLRVAVLRLGRPRGGPNRPPPAGYAATFRTDGRSDYLLAFDFPTGAAGDLTIRGETVSRLYTLPEFGGERAFGSGPESSRFLPLSLAGSPPQELTVRAAGPGVRCEVLAFHAADLPIRTLSLTPLTVACSSRESGYLETPRMYLPGYAATVNGRPARVLPSPAGFAAVEIPPGPARVVVTFVGNPLARRAYWASLLGWIALPGLAAAGAFRRAKISL
jgi:hypothetical protein